MISKAKDVVEVIRVDKGSSPSGSGGFGGGGGECPSFETNYIFDGKSVSKEIYMILQAIAKLESEVKQLKNKCGKADE